MPRVSKSAREELRRIYEHVAAELKSRPELYCEISGRCCRFRDAGHQLFVTRIEFREMRAHGDDPATSDAQVVCPWLKDGLCSNQTGRALACRTYFCSDEDQAAEFGERFHEQIRRLHDRHGLAYEYLSLGDHFARENE